MGNSSSQLQPSATQAHHEPERAQTPSDTGSQILARELEQSAYKSSQAHINRLLNSSPEVHGKYATPMERRRARAAKAASTNVIHAESAFERKGSKRRRLSPPDEDEVILRTPAVATSKPRRRPAVQPPLQDKQSSQWVRSESPEIVYENNVEDDIDEGDRPNADEEAEEDPEVEELEKGHQNDETDDEVEDEVPPHGKVKRSELKKGPFDRTEIAILRSAFERSCDLMNLSREQLQAEIARWGNTGPEVPYKIAFREALPTRDWRSLRKFCRRYFPGLDTKRSGPFSESEKEAIKQTLDETLQAQSLTRAEFLGTVCTGKGPVYDALLAALIAGVPQRSARSLRDYIQRAYKHASKTMPDDAAVERAAHELATGNRPLASHIDEGMTFAEEDLDAGHVLDPQATERVVVAVVIPVEQPKSSQPPVETLSDSVQPDSPQMKLMSTDPISNEVQNSDDLIMSDDDLPAMGQELPESAPDNIQEERPTLQQPTPVTSSSSIAMPEKAPRIEVSNAQARQPDITAEQHLHIFDRGDYYDVIRENLVALGRNPAMADLIENNQDLGTGNDQFWRAVSDAALQSKLSSIGDPALITRLRQIAYCTASYEFQPSPVMRALQNDDQCHPRQKMEFLLDSILSMGNVSAKILPRLWRYDLVDCTREEAAWIRYSEELEKEKAKAKARNQLSGEHDESTPKLSKKAKKRLNALRSRAQAETERASDLAAGGRSTGTLAPAAQVRENQVDVSQMSRIPSSLEDLDQSSDLDDGPIRFGEADWPLQHNTTKVTRKTQDGRYSATGLNARHAPTTGAVSNIQPPILSATSNIEMNHLKAADASKGVQNQKHAVEAVVASSQTENHTTTGATKSKKRRRRSPSPEPSQEQATSTTAAAKLKARHAAKKPKIQATVIPESPVHQNLAKKTAAHNVHSTPAGPKRAYGDMSRETFLQKCRAGGV